MKKSKRITAVICVLVLALMIPALTLAAEVDISADKKEATVGDTVEIKIRLKSDDMSIAEGSFTYDTSILRFEEGSGGAGDGLISMMSAEKDGTDELSARAVFTVTGAGETEVKFTFDKITQYDGDEKDGASASVKITALSAPEPDPAPPVDYSKSGVKAENVKSAETDMYIWKSIENVTIPSRYSVTELEYNGETVEGVSVPDSDAPVLLYLSDAAGGSAGYYIYEDDTLYRYMTISSVSTAYILLEPDGSVPVPEGFTETTLTVDEKQIRAWSAADAQGEVYLVYARNPEGEVGFYAYSVSDESMQRYSVLPARPAAPELPAAEPAPVPVSEPESTQAPVQEPIEKNGVTLDKPVFYAMCGGAAALLIALIAVVISNSVKEKNRKKRAAERRKMRREALKQNEDIDA